MFANSRIGDGFILAYALLLLNMNTMKNILLLITNILILPIILIL